MWQKYTEALSRVFRVAATWYGVFREWVRANETAAEAMFALAIVGIFVSVWGTFFTTPNVKPQVAAVVGPATAKMTDNIKAEIVSSKNDILEEFKRSFVQPAPQTAAPTSPPPPHVNKSSDKAAPPTAEVSGPIAPPDPIASAPARDRASPKLKQAPFRCDFVLAGATAIPFYVQATVTGTSEIDPDAIEKSIASYLPAANFYAAKLEKCAALLIHARVDVGTDSDSNKASARTEIYYGSIRNSPAQDITYLCSDGYDVGHIIWSETRVVSNSIYANITDARLAKFILSNFGIRLNVLAEAGRPMSRCGAVPEAYPPAKDPFRPG